MMAGPSTWNIDSVYRAAYLANECVSQGFVSPTTLVIGLKTREMRDEGKWPEFNHERFTKLEALWDVVEKRYMDVEGKKQARDERVARAPRMYICAAPGCGIEGTKKSALLQCSGTCPANIKPSYCSKECQKAVSLPA